MPTMAAPVSCSYLEDDATVAGTDTPVATASDETQVNPRVTEGDKYAFLEDASLHATAESEAQVEAAQAVPILKRGLKSTI